MTQRAYHQSLLISVSFPSPCPYTELLRQYPSLTNPTRTRESPPHDVVHHIRTTGPASFQRYRRLDPTKKRIAQTDYELGIARPSDNKWASPHHMVKESKPVDWRPCGDCRSLNSVTIPGWYPLPHIHPAERCTVYHRGDCRLYGEVYLQGLV